MSLFLLAGLIFAAWFIAGCTTVVFLYACAVHVQARRDRTIERLARCPDHLLAEWEPDWLAEVTERRA